ncbi:YeaH/YhbH family protein [Chondrinema litorale]|uniref:YeaH/YhbH family protein n=1 Tax=Chondrinema litorale TaxID=2994555 RepID=UPI0025439B27|nr:YeaH/YhbH family protein [Chondrinema litorale]UZR93395.1 YeaH/YhbH family protein [Chondrinema litorale]
MSIIIDRRKNNKGKSHNNRQKFLKRVEGQIKRAIPDIISKESIKDSNTGGKVKVPVKGIKEYSFSHDPSSGNKKVVRPGNDKFIEGDRIPKPQGGKGSGRGKGSNSPEVTEDEFLVELSREEFLKYFFEDLELPNMVKKYMESTEDFQTKRAGYIKYGNPSKLNIKTSYQQSLARQISLRGAFLQKIKRLEEELAKTKKEERRLELLEEIETAKRHSKTIPFFEEVDLRYNNFEQVPLPTTSAVMFCVMDVSASMGYHEKDIAKRFFTLLYLFLTKSYKNVEIVFIRHHTLAKEVDEEEFFNSRESGGTVVAPSLELMHKIIKDRYDTDQWNIYCCQATDGDVWSDRDAIDCGKILERDILPIIQFMAYIEINDHDMDGALWQVYQKFRDSQHFSMRNIYDVNQIWPVFKGLFKKDIKKATA